MPIDSSWNVYPNDLLQQIANTLGYDSVENLPSLNQLSEDQLLLITTKLLNNVTIQGQGQGQNQQITYNIDNPTLDEPQVDLGDGTELTLMLLQLQSKINDLQVQSTTEGIRIQKDSLKAKHEENIKKIQEAIQKMKDAEKSSLIGKIFGWIGAIVAVLAAVALTVATGGSAAPLLAVALVGLALQVAQETGLMDKLMEAMFGDDAKAKMAFMITLQVVMLIAAIVATICSGGAAAGNVAAQGVNMASKGAQIASTGAQIASTATQTATTAATTAEKVVRMTRIISTIIDGVSKIGSGAAQIHTGVLNKEAGELQADVKANKAWIARQQQILDDLTELLERLLKQINETCENANDMLKGIAQSSQQIFQASTMA